MRSENFNRYRAIETGIHRTVNFPHSAGAQRRLDFIGAEFRTRREGHRCRVIIVSSKGIEANPTTLGWWVGYSEHLMKQGAISIQRRETRYKLLSSEMLGVR